MANATVNLTANRGDSIQFSGSITPASGGTLAVPATALAFHMKAPGSGGPVTKTLGNGIAITSSSSSAIAYTVTLAPDDTLRLPNQLIDCRYDIVLTETSGKVSTPVGGIITLNPRVA